MAVQSEHHEGAQANEPGEVAARLEREVELPEGEEERFVGYGVMAAPFASGDLLAMRRFAASSLGQGYLSVWHRAPDGTWTIWSDRDPLEACPRYFGSAIDRAREAAIDVRWPEPRRLEVRVPEAELEWQMELDSTATTRFLNALGQAMPERLWHSERVLSMMGRVAGSLLHAGRLGLAGHAPNGQTFVANPMVVWTLKSSTATIGGRSLGPLAPLAEQTHLGDFWIPQRGLFAFGRSFFEPTDPSRHHVVPQAEA